MTRTRPKTLTVIASLLITLALPLSSQGKADYYSVKQGYGWAACGSSKQGICWDFQEGALGGAARALIEVKGGTLKITFQEAIPKLPEQIPCSEPVHVSGAASRKLGYGGITIQKGNYRVDRRDGKFGSISVKVSTVTSEEVMKQLRNMSFTFDNSGKVVMPEAPERGADEARLGMRVMESDKRAADAIQRLGKLLGPKISPGKTMTVFFASTGRVTFSASPPPFKSTAFRYKEFKDCVGEYWYLPLVAQVICGVGAIIAT